METLMKNLPPWKQSARQLRLLKHRDPKTRLFMTGTRKCLPMKLFSIPRKGLDRFLPKALLSALGNGYTVPFPGLRVPGAPSWRVREDARVETLRVLDRRRLPFGSESPGGHHHRVQLPPAEGIGAAGIRRGRERSGLAGGH